MTEPYKDAGDIQPQNTAKKNGAIAAAIAAVLVISVPIARHFEGLRTTPYHDPGDGRFTVCYGETERAMRDYTPDECAVMLRARQARDYAPQVLKCAPMLAEPGHVNAFAASVDFAYNAGVQTFCRSSMARGFNAGKWQEGCNAFLLYDKARVNGKLSVLKGLQRRRQAETALCLKP